MKVYSSNNHKIPYKAPNDSSGVKLQMQWSTGVCAEWSRWSSSPLVQIGRRSCWVESRRQILTLVAVKLLVCSPRRAVWIYYRKPAFISVCWAQQIKNTPGIYPLARRLYCAGSNSRTSRVFSAFIFIFNSVKKTQRRMGAQLTKGEATVDGKAAADKANGQVRIYHKHFYDQISDTFEWHLIIMIFLSPFNDPTTSFQPFNIGIWAW